MGNPLVRFALGAVAIAAATLATVSPAAAGTPPDDGAGAIDVYINVPPVLETIVDFRLILDGTDVRADYCAESDVGFAPVSQTYRCEGLPDGAYTMEVGELPEGWYASVWECAEPIGYSLFADQPTVGSGEGELQHWGCFLSAGPPHIAAELQLEAGVEPTGDGFGYRFVDEDGVEAEALCGPALDFTGPSACHVVDLGTWTMQIDGAPEGYRTRAACTPAWRTTGNWADPTPTADVTVDDPAWACYGWIWTPVIVTAPADAMVVIAAGGSVIDGACTVQDDGTTWHCIGLDDGTYQLEATVDGKERGINCIVVDESEPSAPLYLDDPSGNVTVEGDEPEQCSVTSGPPEVATTVPASLPDELPPTGDSEGRTAAIAALLVLAGAGCLALASRRPRRT